MTTDVLLFVVSSLLLISLSLWKLFEKANQPGWPAIIPIYNLLVLSRIIGKPDWWTIMYFIPVVNLYFFARATYLLARSYGKSNWFAIGLLLFGVVYFPVLAFSSDTAYEGPYGKIEPVAKEDLIRFEFEG